MIKGCVIRGYRLSLPRLGTKRNLEIVVERKAVACKAWQRLVQTVDRHKEGQRVF